MDNPQKEQTLDCRTCGKEVDGTGYTVLKLDDFIGIIGHTKDGGGVDVFCSIECLGKRYG